MKTKYFLSATVLCASLCVFCHDEGSFHGDGTELSVAPTVKSTDSRAAVPDDFSPKKYWLSDDRMGFFIHRNTGWAIPTTALLHRMCVPPSVTGHGPSRLPSISP